MKELIAIIGIIASITTYVPTDYQLMYQYCDTYYPNYTVCIFTEWNEEVILNRANTGIVYVEKCISISSGGKYGYTTDGCRIGYNTIVPKGEEVISYFIYNPNTNYCDDIVAAIDNQKIR